MLSRLDPRLRRLVLRLPLAAAGALVLWYALVRGPWGAAVIRTSEGVCRLLERPSVTFLTEDQGLVVVRRGDFQSRTELPAFALAPITSNLVLLLTLLFATPRSLRARSPALAVAALAALFASHVVHLVLAVQTVYATNLGSFSEAAYPRWQREVLATGRYFLDIVGKYVLPLVFWGLTLWPGREEASTGAAAGSAGKPKRRRRRRRG